jgi:hypothetical protein
MFLWYPVMDLARAPCRAPLTARKMGSGYENAQISVRASQAQSFSDDRWLFYGTLKLYDKNLSFPENFKPKSSCFSIIKICFVILNRNMK